LFLSSTTTPSYPNSNAPAEDDAGPGDAAIKPVTDAGADAGPVPPHFFSYEAIPFAGGFEGFATPLQAGMSAASASVRVAVDSTGTPGVAAFQPGASYSKQVLFWRPGKQAVSAYTFVVDNGVDLSLAFDGVKPRIAGHMVSPAVDAGEVAPDSLTFLSSDDGITWNPKVNLPSNGGTLGTSFSSALALDGMGHASVVSDINGRTGNDAGCSGNPYIATSADENDGGAVWAACGANTNDTLKYGSYSVSASYGASRLKGTLTASFVTNAIAVDAGANQAGIIYWQAQ
jgi:hypothetical protein